jgi:tRNA 5-methylaminomethyl-2-thiouridine biosynthesis bifunctional protein
MIKQAQLDWSDGTPISTDFDDVYFSKASGLEETQYVFLEQNQLAQRWQASQPDHFTIAETGFGTGLNFLCAWDLWLKHSQSHQHLHFVTVEKFPISKDNLATALSHWPELKELADILIEHYPPLVDGWHVIHLPNPNQTDNGEAIGGQIVLHLYLGDIHEWLPKIEAKVDAWFLDGFAPAKNPEMWSDRLFLQMARLTPVNGTVATFTAAGLVKRGLKAAGFDVKKAKGFGRKRDMLIASQQFINGPQPPFWVNNKPWLEHHSETPLNKTAAVIGAGISGCSTAYSLAKRGWKVTLIEQDEIASGASGNAQGVLYAKLAAEMNLHSQFYLAGYLFSLQQLKQTLPDKKSWDNCGVLQLATNEKEEKRQQTFINRFPMEEVLQWVDAKRASKISGVNLDYSGLFFKDGAWVYPTEWCKQLASHTNINVLEKTNVASIQQLKDKSWQLDIKNGPENSERLNTNILIVCNADQAKTFNGLEFLPTKPVAGQVTQLKQQTVSLKTVLCGDHYVTPTHESNLNFGASYRIKSDNTDVLSEENESNIQNLTNSFPHIAEQLDLEQEIKGRASVRCTSPDYTPIVGAVCEQEAFLKDFVELKKNRKWKFQKSADYLAGLYVNVGHGSRGMSSAPLCGELIAASICGEPLPMPKAQADMLSPNRCLINKLIKG